MGAARSLVIAGVGAAGAAVVLVASPSAYELLRRRLGLSHERRHFEDERSDEPSPSESEAPAGDLRLSLRARLAEDLEVEQATEPVKVAAPAPARKAGERGDTRARHRAARERLEAKAAAAGAAIDAPGDPGVLEDDTADLPLPGGSDGSRD